MSTHRFYLAPDRWEEKVPSLEAADAHHCADVLRLGVGQKVTLFDGEGRVAEAELLEVHRKHCTLRIGRRETSSQPRCHITLAQSVPKGKNMDLVLQKAVELGASAIVPLLTDRTVVRLDQEDAERKRERWQQIALEACKQCGRNMLPRVESPCTVEQFLRNHGSRSGGLLLLASLQPDALPLREVLARERAVSGIAPERVTVMIGPEGDFTPDEIAQALAAGAIAITLGTIILRTETAALYSLSVLGHELF